MTGYKTHRTKRQMEASVEWLKICKEKGISIWDTKLQVHEL